MRPHRHGRRTVYWHHLANTTELVLPLAHPSPQPKLQIDRFSHFCTAHGTASLYFTMGRPFRLKIAPFQWGDLHPIPYMIPWAHPSPQSKWHLDWFSRFCTAQRSVPILYNRPPLLPQNCLFPQGIWTPSNTWFLGPTGVLNANGILIGSAAFEGLTSMAD